MFSLHLGVDANQFSLNGQVDGISPEVGLLPDVVVLDTGASILLDSRIHFLCRQEERSSNNVMVSLTALLQNWLPSTVLAKL